MSRRIFLVDDDEVVRNTLSHGLTEHGFVVTSFADGHSALSQWAINPPDCAVVDIGLPDMSGAELVTQMLSRMHRPVLVLSRHHDSAVVSDAIASGVSGYLVKPVSAVQLVPPIETAIARHKELDEKILARMAGEGDSGAHLDALLEQFAFGVAIVNEQKQVLRRNSAVDRLVADGDVITLISNELHAVEDTDVVQFRQFLDALVGSDSNEDARGQVLALGRNSPGRHVQVWGASLGSTTSGNEPRVAVILMADPDQHTPVPGSVLKSLYGLTATESRLAEALVNGLSVEQFATNSKTSYNTARSHLKSIFVKTRTNRQVDLVRLLTRLVSSLGA